MRILPVMLVVLWWSVGCTTHTGAVGAQAPEPLDRDFSARADVVYTPSDWPEQLTGTVYRPAGPGPHPGVLLVHGGGWEGGQPSDMAFVAERLARRGYVTFNIGYRFAPEYTFPAQLHDVQQAVRWMRANAGTLRLDPGRIAGFGYSAGGHLITLAGMVGRGDPLDSPHGGPQTRLQAIVAGGTPTDLRKFEGGRLVPQFLGTTLQKNPRRYAQASPVTHVDPGDPPTFLYHGSWDGLVPVDHATDMNAALRRAGVPSELYIVNGLGHVPLFVFNRSSITAGIDFLDRVLRAP